MVNNDIANVVAGGITNASVDMDDAFIETALSAKEFEQTIVKESELGIAPDRCAFLDDVDRAKV